MNKSKKILVAGIGNILKSDDGLGSSVINWLRRLKPPQNVELIELGTSGLSILSYVKGYDKVIFIDVIIRGGKPGSIYILKPEDVADLAKAVSPQNLHSMSIHEVNLEKTIAIGRALGEMPHDVVIIGCEPEDVSTSRIGLTDKVREAIPKIIQLIFKELSIS